jgi:hypothetical protein
VEIAAKTAGYKRFGWRGRRSQGLNWQAILPFGMGIRH